MWLQGTSAGLGESCMASTGQPCVWLWTWLASCATPGHVGGCLLRCLGSCGLWCSSWWHNFMTILGCIPKLAWQEREPVAWSDIGIRMPIWQYIWSGHQLKGRHPEFTIGAGVNNTPSGSGIPNPNLPCSPTRPPSLINLISVSSASASQSQPLNPLPDF